MLRPVSADWSAPTPAMRRLEQVAGPGLEAQCARLGELPVGSAVITPAGGLAAEFMVHAVIRSPEEAVTVSGVRRALRNGLRRLAEWAIAEVAMPPLGTGAGNLDAEESAAAMVPVLVEHAAASGSPARVVIVVETEYERQAFERELRRVVGGGQAGGPSGDLEGAAAPVRPDPSDVDSTLS